MQVARVEFIGVASQPGAAPSTEAALIRAAQQRDHDAFEQLVRLHDRSVLRLAMNLLRSEEDARDAYQEAFLRVYRRLDSFNFQSSFHTWLYRIVTNVCLDMLRRKSVRKEQTAKDTPEGNPSDIFERAPDGSAGSDPERVLAGRQLAASIGVAMRDLSPKERMVFEMKHFEGLRLRVIGEMLSISEEAAKNCLFRATRKLRGALKETKS
jgi:RNA polymerase sigma-70 factor, ECF subfamily